jgi:hypothetical protein
MAICKNELTATDDDLKRITREPSGVPELSDELRYEDLALWRVQPGPDPTLSG